MILPSSIRIIFELASLAHASPAILSRCGVVHIGVGVVSFSHIAKAWISTNIHWSL